MLKDFIYATKSQIQKDTGIPAANILISITRAHSARAVESDFLAFADLIYRKKLPGLLRRQLKMPAKTKARKNCFWYGISAGAGTLPVAFHEGGVPRFPSSKN
jgi:hypothetical protein